MLKRGDHIFLKLAEEGVYLNDHELVKANNISIGLSTPRGYYPDKVPQWVKAQVYEYASGVLDCNIVNFNQQNSQRFASQTISSDAIAKLILCCSNTQQLLRLAGLGRSGSYNAGVTPVHKRTVPVSTVSNREYQRPPKKNVYEEPVAPPLSLYLLSFPSLSTKRITSAGSMRCRLWTEQCCLTSNLKYPGIINSYRWNCA